MKNKRIFLLLIALTVFISIAFIPTKTYAASSYKYITEKPTKAGKYYYKTNDEYNLYRSKSKTTGYKMIVKAHGNSYSNSSFCTNGKYIFTVRYKYSTQKSSIVRFNAAGKKSKTIKSLPKGKYYESNSWSISEATGNNIMLSCSNFSAWKHWTYKFNVKSKKLKKVLNNCAIVARSGKYVLGVKEYRSDTSPRTVTIYKLKSSGKLTKVKTLSTKVVVGSPVIVGKKIYYSVDGGDYIVIYRCDRNGKNVQNLGTIYATREYQQIIPRDYTSTGCIVFLTDDGEYQYTYSTKELTHIG